MYGPPLFRKQKMRVTGWSALMYTSIRAKALSRTKTS